MVCTLRLYLTSRFNSFSYSRTACLNVPPSEYHDAEITCRAYAALQSSLEGVSSIEVG